uniref:Uncharacterized protein n=1 Tax=Brassica oleracea TaxID=3712 RepID=A0A3P6FS90_BRAOL|nr:unnamed protein product [Brassica oleracea]
MKNRVLYSWFLGSANLVNNWAYHGIWPDISYRTVRTRDYMLSFVSSPEKKEIESGDGYSEAIFTAATDGAPVIAVQAWMVLSDFPWSSICSREAEPTTHPSIGRWVLLLFFLLGLLLFTYEDDMHVQSDHHLLLELYISYCLLPFEHYIRLLFSFLMEPTHGK